MVTPDNLTYRYLQFKGHEPYRRYIQESVAKKTGPEETAENDEKPARTHGSYGALLFHPHWKARRKKILNRDKHRCVHCSSEKELQVHHRQYHFILKQQKFRLPWDYPDHLLITLCEPCHSRGHYLYKVPTITI